MVHLAAQGLAVGPMNHSIETRPYRIGWWIHPWWPTRRLLAGLVTGNQPAPRADNGSRFVGRRLFLAPIWCRPRRIRRPHRPWQAECSNVLIPIHARRALTAAAAERKILNDVEHQLTWGAPSRWQRRRQRVAARPRGDRR